MGLYSQGRLGRPTPHFEKGNNKGVIQINRQESISLGLAEFIAATNYEDLPETVVAKAKERIIDNLGSCLAGSKKWDFSDQLLHCLKAMNPGESAVFGRNEKLSCPFAALANTAFCHSLELDDGHSNAGVHAGAVVIPTALAVGESLKVGGRELVSSIVLGYEVIYRIARAVNPQQIRKGFHPSATCGVFGAAAVTAKLLGLSKSGIADALGLAGIQSSGLMEATQSGLSSKCVMVGHSSCTGILSAWLAKEGFQGPDRIFEGKFGFFNTMSERVEKEEVFRSIGERFEIGDTYVKLYPTCRHIHPAIESIFFLQENPGFRVDDISRIVVGSHEVAVNLTGNIKEPGDSSEARFSMPYIVSVAVRDGSVGIRHLEQESLSDPILRAISELVEVRVDPVINREFPSKRGANVQLIMKDGRVLEKTTYVLKGSPELPVGEQEILSKFKESSSGILDPDEASHLISVIKGIENTTDICSLIRLLDKPTNR